MISHLPSPVLSVASDVIRELDGEDALSGLWALFTKCKESLKDGRRLENLSWRLWYREIAAQHALASPGSLSPPYSEKQRSQTPITPISEDEQVRGDVTLSPQHALQDAADIQAHSWHGGLARLDALATNRRMSNASAPGSRSSQQTVHFGRLIIDILPGKVSLVPSQKSEAAKPAIQSTVCPTSDASRRVPSRPIVSVQTPCTPPPSTPNFPKVVVVNPTPHPTPPATPQIPSRTTPALPSVTQTPTHLLPPPPTRTLILPPITAACPVKQQTVTPKTSFVSQPVPSPSRDVSAPHGERHDETLKASDRRFFLQDVASPEQDSPDSHSSMSARISERTDGKSDEHPRSPSSATSSQLSHVRSKASGDGVGSGGTRGPGTGAKRCMMRAHARKSKETVRHAPMALHRAHTQPHVQQRSAGTRKATTGDETKKTTFNIGSVSSNGSRGGPSNPRKEEALSVKSRNVKAAPAAQQRREFVVTESSDYETTESDEDSGWASEGNSASERERETKTREESRLKQAAEEAQRQRDMFAKVPRRSYTTLPRTQSGLLSQLMNPDPNIFPPSHPYHRFSSQDMTQFRRQGAPPPLQTSKSSAALPQAAAVIAQAPATDGVHVRSVRAKDTSRPKGRPQGADMEEDTGSEEERAEDGLQLSRSLAHQKLAALAESNRRRHSDRGPLLPESGVRRQLPSVATAPIPLGHPYNLPAPAMPMTPRTTRRQMLSTELSESLRRNLLWERQVSRTNVTAPRRGGVLGNALRPLTAVHDQPRNARGSGSKSGDEDEGKDERKQRNVARNWSWADDYHYAGW